MRFLPNEFKTYRVSKEITQEALAELSGVSIEIIKNIESGKKRIKDPTEKNYVKLCKALHIKSTTRFFGVYTTIITVLSNKGGSTKTTTTANIAYELAETYNKKCLIIDTDLQMNLTRYYNIVPIEGRNFYEAFRKEREKPDTILPHIRETEYPNVDIVTGHERLCLLEDEVTAMKFREKRMTEILQEVKDMNRYDYIFIDCNPGLGGVNTSALMASDGLIIPMIPSAFGEMGLTIMMNTFNAIKQHNKELVLMGITLGRVDGRKKRPKEVVEHVREAFGKPGFLFKTVIPEDNEIDNSQFTRMPIGEYAPNSKAAIAYRLLAEEVIERAKKLRQK